jgi:hypothetical protein
VIVYLNAESDFNIRKTRNRFEKTIFQKGKIIYESGILNQLLIYEMKWINSAGKFIQIG